jgi:hypothetical protein
VILIILYYPISFLFSIKKTCKIKFHTYNIISNKNFKPFKAVLVKLNQATTLTVQQALLLVFARLASADPQGLVTFLTGQNALQPLLQLWLEKQVEIFGAYERRVTVAGLCKLIEYGVQGNGELLNIPMRKKIEGKFENYFLGICNFLKRAAHY